MLRDLLNQQEGNVRKGQRYRDVVRNGQLVHDYAHGQDVSMGVAAEPPSAAEGEFQGAQDLAGMLRGAYVHRQEHRGRNPSVDLMNAQSSAIEGGGDQAGGMLHTNTQAGNPREGMLSQHLQIGGKRFHVYFSPDGQKKVIELKDHPQPQ